ncbi:hypothetical protein [Solimonas terrae]|uniref:Uncharacterized protein n=1 Tax=Solimonas terrae TaxID=1396819 RepID=A0A6M2BWR0_9GAMM|nr:hypothetical protein [Solimonas terrae]NGY06631.1 hypothetical protein [Solimonas terrae]
MKTDTYDEPGALAEPKGITPRNSRRIGSEVKNGLVSLDGHVGRIEALNVELFAAMFLKSPIAKAVLARGEPLKFFLPNSSSGDDWAGVNITIAGVTKDRLATQRELPVVADRGNGYSSNPAGQLKPGDFGVHSHPDTVNLLKPLVGGVGSGRHGSSDPRASSD